MGRIEEPIKDGDRLMTSKRVTLMLDDDIDSKVRKIQAKKTLEGSYSFSRAVNDVLREALK